HRVQRVDAREAALQELAVSAPAHAVHEPVAVQHGEDEAAEYEEDVDLAAAAQEQPHYRVGDVERHAARLQRLARVREEHGNRGDAAYPGQGADLLHDCRPGWQCLTGPRARCGPRHPVRAARAGRGVSTGRTAAHTPYRAARASRCRSVAGRAGCAATAPPRSPRRATATARSRAATR